MTLELSSSCRSGSRQIHRGRKKRVKFAAMSSPCWLFFSDIQGIVHKEFIPPCQTINGKIYCEVLKQLREGIRCKHPDKMEEQLVSPPWQWARSHITRTIPDFQKHYSDSPPYSPNLAPCDFFLFPKMKLWLKGRHFDMTEEIHAVLQEVIDTLTFENFQGCMKSWETCWDHCIHAQGDYFQGDGGN